MTKLLIVAATRSEAGFLSAAVKKAKTGHIISIHRSPKLSVDLLITGPGIAATTYYLTKLLSRKRYNIALNIGICGSLNPEIPPVRVVNITEDQFGDFGAEDGNNQLDIFEIGLANKNEIPFRNGKLKATFTKKLGCLKALPAISAITVQLTHGSAASCLRTFKKYGAVMESMEGAAFFYVCLLEKVKCLQIRAVSNKVERRNRDNWKVQEALDALAGFTGLLLLELETMPE
jgi:futalosine hydrolase